jgi:hypothetical protein
MRVCAPKTAYLLLIILAFASSSAFAWTEPVKIVDYSYSPIELRGAAVGETLYYAFISDHYQAVCYGYSRDNGQTWSRPFFINDTSRHFMVQDPEIKYSNGQLHYIWSELTIYPQIWHSKSTNGGRSWTRPNKAFNNSGSRVAFYPKLAANGDSLFLICVIYDTNGYSPEYLFFRSFNAGETWQDSMPIERGPLVGVQHPYLLYSQGIIHFIHPMGVDVDSFGIEIYYRKSSDYGITWSDRIILSPAEMYPHPIDSQIPSAYADTAGHVLVAWMDYANGSSCGISGDIFYRVSLDNGTTWQAIASITNTQSGEDSYCLITGNKYIVAWDDFWLLGCNFGKEAYSVSTDSGVSWSVPEFISGPVAANEHAPILISTIDNSDTILHCLFIRSSYDTSIDGIYYMRDHDFVGINNDTPMPTSTKFWVKAYPNPFNSSTLISFSNLKDDEIRIFDIKGALVRILRPEQKANGSIIWDATDDGGQKVSSGIYFAKAISGGNSKTIKLIYLK